MQKTLPSYIFYRSHREVMDGEWEGIGLDEYLCNTNYLPRAVVALPA